jgi:transcriptional regulator with XRE-family HTH domain
MRKVVAPELGSRIKQARKTLRIQQKEFASSLGISASYLSEVESGKIKPGFEFFVKITGQFNVNPMYLLHGEEPVIIRPVDKLAALPGIEEIGLRYPDLHQMIWYVTHSKMVGFGVLEFFQRYLAKYEDVIHKELESRGKSYPGSDGD